MGNPLVNADDVTIALLAGGQSRRMQRDKSLVLLAGKPLIQHVLDRLQALNLPLILITNQSEVHGRFGIPMFGDVLNHRGSLIGLHSALYHSPTAYTVCIGCDMPLVNAELVADLIRLRVGYDAVVPRIGHTTEPLHAVYHRSNLKPIEAQIEKGELQISRLLDHLRVRYVLEDELKRADPLLRSFTNLNTPDELAQLERELSSG